MDIGHSRMTDTILRFISDEKKYEMACFIDEALNKNYLKINNQEQLKNIFEENVSEFLNNVTPDELLDLRTYTGYYFKNINAVLRNTWNYEENGRLTEEEIKKYRILSDNISSILNKFPSPNYNFTTYRGTTIDSFSKYGITSVGELEKLKGKYMYEQGFTSTSVIEDTCYFNKKLDTGKNYNVEIRYLITPEYDEGALLLNNDMSYSVNQNEYLINKGSLSKVIDVEINNELNQAILTVIIIPRKKWDIVKEENKVK